MMVTIGRSIRSRLVASAITSVAAVAAIGTVPASYADAPGTSIANPRLRHWLTEPRLTTIPPYPDADAPEPAPDSTLVDAIAMAYRTNPTLQAARYDLRATDQSLGSALSELRPSSQIQVITQYNKTVPGETTQATRLFAQSQIITTNTLTAQAIVSQPVYTGGKATADIAGAKATIRARRAALLASEGDLLLQTIIAYMDVRLNTRSLSIRLADLAQFQATLVEVRARREAGELTQTDISQTETQMQSSQEALDNVKFQLEQSRSTYATLVGAEPGNLAPEPPLPQLPVSIDDAIDLAEQADPDLSEARYNELASRHKIASARAANHPTFAIQGQAILTGQAVPFYLHNQDQQFALQGVLTIPLTSGGQNGAAIAAAENTNSGDRLRIESTRRVVMQNILSAWNQMVAARRTLKIVDEQVKSAATFYEGSLAEYRAGVRSTFDVLYAQEILLNARIQQLSSKHDAYVAAATLLRYVGLLEVSAITTGIPTYDPISTTAHIETRGATPWDTPIRALDKLGAAGTQTQALRQPAVPPGKPAIAPELAPPPSDDFATHSPVVPEPGTMGRPVP